MGDWRAGGHPGLPAEGHLSQTGENCLSPLVGEPPRAQPWPRRPGRPQPGCQPAARRERPARWSEVYVPPPSWAGRMRMSRMTYPVRAPLSSSVGPDLFRRRRPRPSLSASS